MRALCFFVLLVLGSITLICALFLALDVVIPEWFVIVGRWLPALLTLLVLRWVPLPGGLAHWWALRPGGWARLLGGSAAALAALLAVYALAALGAVVLGLAEPQPWSALGQVVVMLIPTVLVFSVSTFGEEVAWRGFAQRALARWGFWGSSSAIAALWVLFHVPLHGVMASQGTIPWVIALTSTVGLFPLGLFLSAVVLRFRSVWPAVFAHALPFSTLNLLTGAGDLGAGTLWLVTGITAVLMTGAALAFAPRSSLGESGSRPGTPGAEATLT